MTLKSKAVYGMVWTYTQQFGSQLMSFCLSIFLSRILLPSEFGLLGMIAVFIGIGNVLFEGGMTSSLIRSKERDTDDYSTVFYFNIAASVGIYILLFLSAPFIANFYNQPILAPLTRVYGLTFILSSFGTVQHTILTIHLQFKKQTLVSLPALVLSGIVGVLLALRGFGVWSIVASSLVNAFLTSALLWYYSDWYPRRMFSIKKFRDHFGYGYKLTLSGLVDIVYTNIYQIVIGRYYVLSQVGYYTRANTLMMLPVGNISTALNRVVFPLFSQVQDDIPRFRKAYRQVMQMVLFIVTPIIGLMAVLAEPLVTFLFTEKWLPCVPIFQIICLSGVLYPIHLYNLLVLQVKGRSDLFLRLELWKKVLLTIILFISFRYGFYALLWGQLVYSILALLVNTYYAGKMLNYSVARQLRDIAPVIVYAALMCLCVIKIDNFFRNQSDLFRLLIGSILGIFVYIALAYFTKFPSINDIKTLFIKNDSGN